MKCRQAQNFIQMELDGLLMPELAENLNRHIEECPACAAYREEALALHALLSENLILEDAPENFAAQVMAKLPTPISARQSVISKSWRRYALSAAAILLVLAASSLGALQEQPALNNPGLPVAEDPGEIPSQQPDIQEPITPEEPTTQPETQPETKPTEDNTPPITNQENQPALPVIQEPITQDQPDPDQQQPGESGELYLPQVAYGSQTNGDFSLTLLADHNGLDAFNPKTLAGGEVEYLVSASDGYQLWKQDISASNPPHLIDEAGSSTMGVALGDSGEIDWLTNLDCFVALSPDSSMVAANIKGENGGLWFSDNNSSATPTVLTRKAGGNILAWSPNSGKIAFNDSLGRLYVAYPLESLVLLVFDGNAKSASWSEDSNTLVFSGKKAADGYSKIFSITIP